MPDSSLTLGIVIGAAVSASLGNAFRTVEQKSKRIGDAMKKARLGAALPGDVIKYKNSLEKLKKKQAALGYSSKRLNKGIEAVERRYKTAKQAAKKYGIEIGDVVRQHRKFERSARDAERALARMGRRQRNKQIRGEMRGQALGVVGALYAAQRMFKAPLAMEESEVRLRTVLNTDDMGRDLQAAREHAIAFARGNMTSQTEMINIQYALNSAGLEASAARLGSEVVAKVATVTQGAPEQVGEVIATVFNNLGDSLEGNTQEKLNRIGELLTKTQFKFQIRDFGQLGESMKYGAPAFAQYNMDLAQGVTLLGQLNNAGLQGGQAGTSFAATMRNMSKASEEFGFEMVRNKKGQFDFIATLEQMSDAIGGFDNLDQETIDDLQRVFGEEGIRGVVLLGKKLGDLRQAQQDVTQSSKGLVDESYQHFLDSTGGKLKIFGNNILLIGEAFAGAFLPVLQQALPPLIAFASQIGMAIQANPELAKTIAGVAVGLIGLKTASVIGRFGLTLLSDGATFLGGAFGFLRTGLGGAVSLLRFGGSAFVWMGKGVGKATLAVVRLGVALLASPITWIVGAVAALAAGAYLVYKNWEPVSNFFFNMWTKIKAVFAGGIATVLESIESVINKFPDWALPEGLEADNIGATIAKYRELANVTGKLKPVDFTLPTMDEVMDDMGMSGLMDKLNSMKSGFDISMPKLPDMSMPKFPDISSAKGTAAVALSGIIAASPAAAVTPQQSPTQVTVHAPISIQSAPGMDEERLAELVDQRLEAAVTRAVTEARGEHG